MRNNIVVGEMVDIYLGYIALYCPYNPDSPFP